MVYCKIYQLFDVFLQILTVSICIVAGDISVLIEGFSAAIWVFYGLSFLSLLIMRFTHKNDKRPFKVQDYICMNVTHKRSTYNLLPVGLVDRACRNDYSVFVSDYPSTDHYTGAISGCLCHYSQWDSSVSYLCHGEALETQTKLLKQI